MTAGCFRFLSLLLSLFAHGEKKKKKRVEIKVERGGGSK